MCQLQGSPDLEITEEVIEAYVKKDYYPIEECLEICREYKQHRAISALLERDGQTVDAIEHHISHLQESDLLKMG